MYDSSAHSLPDMLTEVHVNTKKLRGAGAE